MAKSTPKQGGEAKPKKKKKTHKGGAKKTSMDQLLKKAISLGQEMGKLSAKKPNAKAKSGAKKKPKATN